MGRAIVRDPQVFLFDEPLSNLDAKLRVADARRDQASCTSGSATTTIYVTHDQVEAMTHGRPHRRHAATGAIEQVGTPLELYDRPGQPVRRRLHRLARDELHQGQDGPGRLPHQ